MADTKSIRLRYRIEAFLLGVLMTIFAILPPGMASGLGGFLGRHIGPQLGATKKAWKNLGLAMPELSGARKFEIIEGMWEHLGRIIGEYPHLESLAFESTQIFGTDNLQMAMDDPKGAVFWGGHLGNWEINAAAVLVQYQAAIDLSYRAPNNPWVDKMLLKARSMNGRLAAHPKSRQGGKAMIDAIKNGGALGILIDQKYNQGIASPFFGVEAMTNPFFVQLAQKFGCSLVPIRNRRLQGAHFSLTVYPAIDVFDEEGKPRAIDEVVAEAHALLEGFIRETPEQWLWLHRRWPPRRRKAEIQKSED